MCFEGLEQGSENIEYTSYISVLPFRNNTLLLLLFPEAIRTTLAYLQSPLSVLLCSLTHKHTHTVWANYEESNAHTCTLFTDVE